MINAVKKMQTLFLEELKKQGFPIILIALVGLLVYNLLFGMLQRQEAKNMELHQKQDKRTEMLETKLDECQNQYTDYIRNDRDQMMKIVEDYTEVLKTLKK